MLTNLGHEVTLAVNKTEVLELSKINRIDFIFVDFKMTVMDGIQVTRLIRGREIQSGTHTSRIAITAYAMKGDRKRCLKAGIARLYF